MERDTFVVARYNEEIEWIKAFPGHRIIIYNKGSEAPILDSCDYEINMLPNIGREAHTYLHHIVHNYNIIREHPDRVTFFTQGSVIDHGHTKSSIDRMMDEARRCGFSDSMADTHQIDPIHQPVESFRILRYKDKDLLANRYNESFGTWFERCLQQRVPCRAQFKWIVGAIFAVRNDVITRHSQHFYEGLLGEIQEDHAAPEVAHFFERSWYYIFRPRPFYVPGLKDVVASNLKVLVVQVDTRPLCTSNPYAKVGSFLNDSECPTIQQIYAQFMKENENVKNMMFDMVHVNTYLPTTFTVKKNWSNHFVSYTNLSSIMNKLQVRKKAQWSYEYINVEQVSERHPSWLKSKTIHEKVEKWSAYDIVVVMDTDAWIRDVDTLDAWIVQFVEHKDKHMMFAAEPYCPDTFRLMNQEQYINGGLTIFKPCTFVYDFMKRLYELPETNPEFQPFKLDWSFEQICMSWLIDNDKSLHDSIMIVPCNMFNTPCGTVIAHCWWKDVAIPLLVQEILQELLQHDMPGMPSINKTGRIE